MLLPHLLWFVFRPYVHSNTTKQSACHILGSDFNQELAVTLTRERCLWLARIAARVANLSYFHDIPGRGKTNSLISGD
jgi:hypothetical protein